MTAPSTLILTFDPPITLETGPNRGPFSTLELAEPLAGEMRVANGQVRNGVNHENQYLRNAHLIAAVTKRLGSPWPIVAIERIPDGQFTEASNFLLGFQERAHLRSMQEAARTSADADADQTADD
jgi:hypothetical protein